MVKTAQVPPSRDNEIRNRFLALYGKYLLHILKSISLFIVSYISAILSSVLPALSLSNLLREFIAGKSNLILKNKLKITHLISLE